MKNKVKSGAGFTKTFHQLSKADVGIAGGKGASLGEMTRG